MTWWQTTLAVIGAVGVTTTLLAVLFALYLEARRLLTPVKPVEVFDWTDAQKAEFEEWIQGGAR